jgi:hypothetical protein
VSTYQVGFSVVFTFTGHFGAILDTFQLAELGRLLAEGWQLVQRSSGCGCSRSQNDIFALSSALYNKDYDHAKPSY